MTTPKTPAAVSRFIIAAALIVAMGAAVMSTRAFTTAPQTAPAPVRLATLDSLAVVEKLVLSDKYAPARDALALEKNKAMEPLAKTMDDILAKAKLLQNGSPELQTLQQQYQQAERQLEQLGAAAKQELEALNVKQISEAFTTVNESAAALADKLGYTHVIASRTGPTALRSSTVNLAVQEMIARTVIKAPAEDDITQKLIEELGLTAVQVPVAPAVPQDPAAAPAP